MNHIYRYLYTERDWNLCLECVIIPINERQVDFACSNVHLIQVIESNGDRENVLTASLPDFSHERG